LTKNYKCVLKWHTALRQKGAGGALTLALVKRRGRRQEKQRETERETERWPVSSLSDRDKELSDKNGKKGGMDGEKVEG